MQCVSTSRLAGQCRASTPTGFVSSIFKGGESSQPASCAVQHLGPRLSQASYSSRKATGFTLKVSSSLRAFFRFASSLVYMDVWQAPYMCCVQGLSHAAIGLCLDLVACMC